MNQDDEAYYAAAERDRELAALERSLTELRTNGVRAPLHPGAGTVAVTAFGVVLDVALDEDRCRHLANPALAGYLVAAIDAAGAAAARRRRDLLAYETETTR